MAGRFHEFDGSGRPPRNVQIQGLSFVDKLLNMDQPDLRQNIAIQAPVGSGKSGILKAIQKVYPQTAGVTSAVTLQDQYGSDYPEHNVLKGKARYECHVGMGMNCADWSEYLRGLGEKQLYCDNCPYQTAKARAACTPTIYNPMSYFYNTASSDEPTPLIVVDEAHQLASMLLEVSGVMLKHSKYKFPDNATDPIVLIEFLNGLFGHLKELKKLYLANKKFKEVSQVQSELERVHTVLFGLTENQQNYALYIEDTPAKDTVLHVKPIRPPRGVVKRVLDSNKIILMSGTLFKSDIKDLFGDAYYHFLDLPSPIPVSARPVYFKPMPFKVNYQTDPALMVAEIEKILTKRPGRNTIIHVSYALQKRLLPHFNVKVLHNTTENKAVVIERFKKEGGVFLASGCAEGLDLKDDLCRLNIIPQLLFPNRKDPVVAKRLGLPDGDLWYDLETMKVAIQQTGRSTRHEKDFSETVIMDPMFPMVYNKLTKLERRTGEILLPRSFKEQIEWSAAF